ncbi:uncharacterized protein LOC143023595 [Oratosquilla oratoria]|uniref:uncharacterized protein LOC143023595 n=1 Tax=Oratosquilla oratoria TaxID=337810 RepID=UPI003F762586
MTSNTNKKEEVSRLTSDATTSKTLYEKEEGRLLHFHNDGNIVDDDYCTPNSVILFITNCVELKGYGVSASLENRYPYMGLFKERVQLFNTGRATFDTQSRPGDVKIYVKDAMPILAALTPHYGSGPEIENNPSSLQKIKSSVDASYTAGLQEDTLPNRLTAFQKGLESLWCYLTHKIHEGKKITSVVAPVASGVGLKKSTLWYENYFPVLMKFAMKTLFKHNITLILIGPKKKVDSSEPIPDTPMELPMTKKRKIENNESDEIEIYTPTIE